LVGLISNAYHLGHHVAAGPEYELFSLANPPDDRGSVTELLAFLCWACG